MPRSSLPPISESAFQSNVIELAHLLGWRVAHFRPARTEHGWRTPVAADGAGFPDLTLVRGHELVISELKSDKGKPSTAQTEWLRAFADVRTVDAYLWRPGDLDEINQRLSPRVTRRAA